MSSHVLPIVPQITDDPLEQYAFKMLRLRQPDPRWDEVIQEMETTAAAENIPIIGPVEGAVLQALVGLRQPRVRHILDIGTAIGYSALWLARGAGAAAQVWSIELNPTRAERARDFIARAGFSERITVLDGDVFDLWPTLDQAFDVIFQDVIKHAYFGANPGLALKLLDHCIDHLADDGVLIGDNAFCLGEVTQPATAEALPVVAGIQAYNTTLAQRSDLESVIIPIRDGLWVSYRRASA